MAGSFLINCWAALFAFAISFFLAFRHGTPLSILLLATAIAAGAFLLAYPFRALLAYAFRPAPIAESEIDRLEEAMQIASEPGAPADELKEWIDTEVEQAKREEGEA